MPDVFYFAQYMPQGPQRMAIKELFLSDNRKVEKIHQSKVMPIWLVKKEQN